MKKLGWPLAMAVILAMVLSAGLAAADCGFNMGDWKISLTDISCSNPMISGPVRGQYINDSIDVSTYSEFGIASMDGTLYVQSKDAKNALFTYPFYQLANWVLTDEMDSVNDLQIKTVNGRDWAIASGISMGSQAWGICTLLDNHTLICFRVYDNDTLEKGINGFQAVSTKKTGQDQFDPN